MELTEIIDEAYERVGIEMRTGFELRSARRSLNLLLMDWANNGVNYWTVSQQTIALTVGQVGYTLSAATVDILSAVLRRGGTDFTMERLSRAEYLNLPNKAQAGFPSQFYLDRQTAPVLKLYQAPDSAADVIIADTLTQIAEVDGFRGVPGVPFRFVPAMISGLAFYLSLKHSMEKSTILKAVYDDELQRAIHEDRDRASFRVAPFG